MSEQTKEEQDANKGINTFYRAYCIDEGTWIGGSSGDRVVAQNRADHHSRNTGHSCDVRET
jgi:hypothetical protein